MSHERTELEWKYEPSDFFEAPYQCASADFSLVMSEGRALVTLSVPVDPVPEELEKRVKLAVDGVLLVRQVQVHRRYTLVGPNTYQYSAAGKSIAVRPDTAHLLITAGHVDFVMTDPSGKIVRDTRAERIAEHTAFIDSLAPKVPKSFLLRSLLEMYSRAVSDPKKELVHLYDVRDALSKYYGKKELAIKALHIIEGEWNRFGKLANDEPIRQGRHAGKHHQNLRNATEVELADARNLVKKWITSFAETV